MKRLRYLCLSLLAAGCSSHNVKDVAGHWKSTAGTDYVFDGTNAFKATVHRNGRDVPETGDIAMKGDEVSLTVTTVNGRAISDVKAILQRKEATLTPRLQAITRRLGQPDLFKLSNDARTLVRENSTKPYSISKQ